MLRRDRKSRPGGGSKCWAEPLGGNEGLPVEGVASLDNIETLPKSGLVRRVGVLAASREHEVCTALRNAVDC